MNDLSSLLKEVENRSRLLSIDAALDPSVVRRVLLSLDEQGASEAGDVIQSLLWHSQLMNNWSRKFEVEVKPKQASFSEHRSADRRYNNTHSGSTAKSDPHVDAVKQERPAYALENHSEEVNYDPENLLNTLIKTMRLKNDAALSRVLRIAPPVISKIRHGSLPIGPSLLLYMHEVSDMSIRDLRALMGDHRRKFTIIEPVPRPKFRDQSSVLED